MNAYKKLVRKELLNTVRTNRMTLDEKVSCSPRAISIASALWYRDCTIGQGKCWTICADAILNWSACRKRRSGEVTIERFSTLLI